MKKNIFRPIFCILLILCLNFCGCSNTIKQIEEYIESASSYAKDYVKQADVTKKLISIECADGEEIDYLSGDFFNAYFGGLFNDIKEAKSGNKFEDIYY